MAPSAEASPIRVAIISSRRETLDDLGGYLDGVGVHACRLRGLDGVRRLARGTAAVVIFPDEYSWEKVLAAVAELATVRPRILPVLVTRQCHRYERVLENADYVLIVPRPVWAWAIFDAIREHLTQHLVPGSQ